MILRTALIVCLYNPVHCQPTASYPEKAYPDSVTLQTTMVDDTCQTSYNNEFIVIRSAAKFRRITGCPIKLNFRKYQVVLFRVQSGGCSDPVIKSDTYLLSGEKVLGIDIKVIQQGQCKKLILSKMLLIIPRVKASYAICFTLNHAIAPQGKN